MLNVTTKMMDEHQLILRYADLLELRLEGGDKNASQPNFWSHLEQIRDFIREYADHYHHAKEENVLFEFLSKPGVLTHCNPLGQMMHEHTAGRDFVQGLSDAIQKEDLPSAVGNGLGWVELIRVHIYKEDHILYTFAEEGLSDQDKEEILKIYEKIEKEKDSVNLQRKFETLEKELLRSLG